MRIEDDLPGAGATDAGISIPEWKDLQRSGIFQYVVLQIFGSVNLTGASQPARMQYEGVSPAYFAMMGVKPELGHTFDPQDQTPGFTLEVVISDGLWKRAFGSDPHIVGRSLRGDNDLYRVIGVMPPGFHDPGRTVGERNTELWAATGFSADPAPPPEPQFAVAPGNGRAPETGADGGSGAEPAGRVGGFAAEAISGRLSGRQQVDDAVGAAEGKRGGQRSAVADPAVGRSGAGAADRLRECGESAAGARQRAIAGDGGAPGAGSGTQTAGAAVADREPAAFAAGRSGGVGDSVLHEGILAAADSGQPASAERPVDQLDGDAVRAGGFERSRGRFRAGAGEAGRAVGSGDTLRVEGRGSKGSTEQTRTRRVLVVTEFALSLVLMVAAGLLLRSFWDLYKAPLGFNPQHVMSAQLWLPSPNDPKTDIYGTAAQEAVFARELLRRSRLLPGVQEAALGSEPSIPLHHDRNMSALIVEGRQTQSKQPPLVERSQVTPEYFHLLGIPLLRGRLFNDGDDENAPLVAVINQAMARDLLAW